MTKTKRVKIVTGLKCNIQCVFCYYRDSLKAPNRTFDSIKKDLLYAKRHSIEEIDFSGGEPTVHPDLVRLITEAKTAGMKRVCIISNGYRLADRAYVRSLKDAGLDEILFSVHGSCDMIHDQITMVPSSFERLTNALSHATEEGIVVRTNSVVNRINVTDLSNIGSFVLQFNPVQVNFITINDWCFAKNLVDQLMVTYGEMSPYLKAACDHLDRKVKAVNVRYIPFCFMQGFERFVCNHKQVPYDPYEWVPSVRTRLEVQNNVWRYLGILGYGYVVGGAFRNTFNLPFREVLDESVVEALRHWYYKKHTQCRGCRFDDLCDGVEKTYAKKYGLEELNSCTGDIIKLPLFFRGDAA